MGISTIFGGGGGSGISNGGGTGNVKPEEGGDITGNTLPKPLP